MDHQSTARLYAALASEIRLQIVELISANREMCVCELVDQLDMSQANISRHVGILRDAGVIEDRKVGTWVLLRVNEMSIEQASRELLDTVRRNHGTAANEDAVARLEGRCASIEASTTD